MSVSGTLQDLCSIVTDGTHDSPKLQSAGVPFIKGKNIAGGRVDFSTCDFISEKDHAACVKRIKPQRGDILFSNIGSVGDTALVDSDIEFSIKNVALFRPDPSKADPRYVYYLVCSDGFRSGILNQRSGAAQPFISLGNLRSFEFSYDPDLPTQRRIAGILAAYDDLIENNLRRIRILEEMAQSLYREWFVHFRFPGHESVPLVDSPLGPIPEGWEVKKVGDIAAVNAETIRPKSAPDEITYIDIASVSTGSVDDAESMLFADAPSRARRIVRHGDVIWSTVRPNRRSFALILDPVDDLVVSTGFAVLSPRAVPSSYLYQAVTTDDFTSYLVNHATGAAYPAVNAPIFEAADVLLPPGDLLERFDSVVGRCLSLRASFQRRNQALRQTRDLLLPKLLSQEASSHA